MQNTRLCRSSTCSSVLTDMTSDARVYSEVTLLLHWISVVLQDDLAFGRQTKFAIHTQHRNVFRDETSKTSKFRRNVEIELTFYQPITFHFSRLLDMKVHLTQPIPTRTFKYQ